MGLHWSLHSLVLENYKLGKKTSGVSSMTQSRKANATRNIVWGIGGKIVTLLMPFITRTVLIYTIGIQYAGLHSLFTSVLSVLSLAELGVGNALVFAMYKPIAEHDTDKVCALLSLYRKCYLVIGCAILIIGLCMLPFLGDLITGETPDAVDVRVLFLIYLANSSISYFMFAYKQSLFIANQRVDAISKLTAISSLVSCLLQVGALILFANYYLYAIVLPVITLANNLAIGYLSKKAYPDFVCRGSLMKSELRSIEKNVAGLVFVKVGSVVLSVSDTLVISAFLGLWTLGVYNGYSIVITAVAGLIGVIQGALIPTIGNKIAMDSKKDCLHAFGILNFLYMWLAIVAFSCLAGLLQPFVSIWQGAENTLAVGIPLLLSLCFLVQRSGEMSWMFREAAGLWWEGKYLPFMSSVINLALSLVLVNFIGIYGVIIATVIALFVVNLPMGARFLFKHYFDSNKDCCRYLASTLGYLAFGCVVGAVSFAACEALSFAGVPGLLVRLTVCLLVSNAALFLAFCRSRLFGRAMTFISGVVPHRIRESSIGLKLFGAGRER